MTRVTRLIRSALFTLVLLPIFALSAWSQATWGTISGFVTDPSGAAIPNVNIAITNEGTGIQTKATTDSAGLYITTHLDPGQYNSESGVGRVSNLRAAARRASSRFNGEGRREDGLRSSQPTGHGDVWPCRARD